MSIVLYIIASLFLDGYIIQLLLCSFSDGGRYGQEAESAVHRVLSLLNDGADMIDIGRVIGITCEML